MAKFRKKPVVIDAIQYRGDNSADIVAFFDAPEAVQPIEGAILIMTLEGTMRADVGDWIIKGVQHELYPCKPEIFAATYEPVNDDEATRG